MTPPRGTNVSLRKHLRFSRVNEARTNIGLSPTLVFLNENNSLAYFAILGELSSGLYFSVGFFQT